MQKQWLSVVFIQKNKESRSWVWIMTQNELSTRWHYSTVFRRNAAVSASNVSLKSCHFITVRKNRLFIRGFIKPVCWWNMNRLIFRLKSQQDGTPECCHISAWLAESSKNCHSCSDGSRHANWKERMHVWFDFFTCTNRNSAWWMMENMLGALLVFKG